LWAQGDLAAALSLSEQALLLRQRALPHGDTDIAQSHLNLARLVRDTGNVSGARNHAARALAIYEAAKGPDHPDVATSLTILARTMEDDVAASMFERSRRIFETELGAEHPAIGTSLLNLAGIAERQAEFARAREHIENALEIYTRILGPDHRVVGYSLSRLARVLQKQGETAAARVLLANAMAIYEKWFEPDHPDRVALRTQFQAVGGATPA
jgi:tetratricopeptide (TPR) repeat protein